MSNIQPGIFYTSTELALFSNLGALTPSSATQAIQKTGATTFANVELNVSGAIWGQLTGTLSNQTDLQTALNLKAPLASPVFTTQITTPLIYGSSAANGDITIEGTSDATKTTSYVILQPTAGNVGIGTTSPAYPLVVTGVSNSGYAQIMANGTAAADFLMYHSGAALNAKWTGFRSQNGIGTISSFTDAGGYQKQGILAWDNLTGNIGIGTTTPTSKLQVSGALPKFYLSDTSGALDNKHWFMENNAGVLSFGTTTDALGVSATRALSISNAGVVTLGQPEATTAQLNIKGGASGTSLITLTRTVGVTSQWGWALAGGGLTFTDVTNTNQVAVNIKSTNSLNAIYLGQGGKTELDSNDSLLSATTYQGGGSQTDYVGKNLTLQGGLGTGAGTLGNIYFKTGVLGTSGTTLQTASTRMTILGNGNVGIGQTAPGAKLDIGAGLSVIPLRVTGIENGGASVYFRQARGTIASPTNSGSADGFYQKFQNYNGGYQDIAYVVGQGESGAIDKGSLAFWTKPSAGAIAERVRIDSTGNVGIGTTSPSGKLDVYLTSSDATTLPLQIGKGTAGNYVSILNNGNVGIGTTNPTASLMIKAGTATANTQPIKLVSGVNATTAETGAFEYDGTSLYFTAVGTVREMIHFGWNAGATLTAGTTTTITDARAKTTSTIFLQATSAAFTPLGAYISTKNNGSFVITTTIAAGTETFDFLIVN